MSYSEIARTLNERGVRTRTGRLFHAQTVKNVAFRLRKSERSTSRSLIAVDTERIMLWSLSEMVRGLMQ
jgi:hypothetical protein